MKKWLASLLAVVMLLSLCACTTPASSKGTPEELDEIMQDISQIPVATMGVSMIITARASELLDWCEATTVSGEESAALVKQFRDSLNPDVQSLFDEQVAEVLSGVGVLSKDEYRAKALEAAGLNTGKIWSEKAFTLVSYIDDQL